MVQYRKYMYKKEENLSIREINEFGDTGWELISVTEYNKYVTVPHPVLLYFFRKDVPIES